jgi:Protein of unknown function (DUF3570)
MKMKKYLIVFAMLTSFCVVAQEKDSTAVFKKRVLDATEVDFLLSYYNQDGVHSSVSGGMGTEELTDFASNIVISMPLNADDVLTVDVGISAYTSASSSNINPFNSSGSSGGGDDDDDGYDDTTGPYGTPWLASSGASGKDTLVNVTANYSHSSDNRNFIWNADVSYSQEYDYSSMGFGGGIAKLFNEKNTELSIKANVYLDQWKPIYPTELHEYSKYGVDFMNSGYFAGVPVYDQNGDISTSYLPSQFETVQSVDRNSYSLSFSFSQIVTKKLQLSLFCDVLKQEGLLSTPYHRIYFADKENYYIGKTEYIPVYETPENVGVYRLADDIERLPDTRFKFPLGMRLNYYINEFFKIRTYYRYYSDDWGITAHTANIEVPIKLSDKFTIFPMYRYYTQSASKYFAPFEMHVSTEEYYTSDYDLSKFNSNQYGMGVSYLDIFTKANIWKFGLKNIDLRYNHYDRSDTLSADIVSVAFKFVFQ